MNSDHALAAQLATQAGALLLAIREELADASGPERKAAGDKRSHDFLMEALADSGPTTRCSPRRAPTIRSG